MALKDWLRSKKAPEERDYTPDELIGLERYDEAKAKLADRLRYYPKDLSAHLKLGDVYRHLGDAASCREEYLHVASAYAEDGFYDKARAVLVKISRFFPDHIDVDQQMAALQRAKWLDYSRDQARRGLLAHGRVDDTSTGRLTVEFEQVWNRLARTSLVDQISSADFALLFENVSLHRVPEGTALLAPGPEPVSLYIVVEGALEARALDRHGHRITLKSFGTGAIVGETVLFEGRRWPAEYACEEDSMLLELTREGLERLARNEPEPAQLLTVLRGQGNDGVVLRAVRHLRG